MKIDRLMSIVLVLLDKKRISARELADMFEVSLRTVYRDIDAIDLAGIPIRSIPGINGGFEIMPKYKLDNKVFTTSDLAAILTGLSGLSDMLRGDELLNAIAKIKSFVPAEKTKEETEEENMMPYSSSPYRKNCFFSSFPLLSFPGIFRTPVFSRYQEKLEEKRRKEKKKEK